MEKVYLPELSQDMYLIPSTDGHEIYSDSDETNPDSELVVNYIRDDRSLNSYRIDFQVELSCGPLRYCGGEYRMLDPLRGKPRDIRNADLATLFREISEYKEK